jgi:hypothetical protein
VCRVLSGMEDKTIDRFPVDNILGLGSGRIVSKFLSCHILSYQSVFEVWSSVAGHHAQRCVYPNSIVSLFPHASRA